mgnify:CR=1 FL=1
MMYDNTEKLPRAILVAVDTGEYDAETSLLELEELARTAGVEVAATSIQKRPAPDSATVVGSGRLRELTEDLERLEADMLIFDCELTGSQTRNIGDVTGAAVVDRTMLILDIFAARARSSEGRLQVELAQLRYRLPRLAGSSENLSRLGGGIGTAITGWLLAASAFDRALAVQPDSCINMLKIMYLIIPFVLDAIITFILSRMKVEEANEKLRTELNH